MTITHRLFPPTSVVCPSWCTEPEGHEYDQEFGAGESVRQHVASHGLGGNVDVVVAADVCQFAVWTEGAERLVDRPEILVYVNGDCHSGGGIGSPEHARQLAGLLMDAADTLEAIQGGAQ